MMHHCTKSVCKWFRSSEDMEESYFFEDFTPHCDLDLGDRKRSFSHGTPGHDDAPPYQVPWRKVKWFRRYNIVRTNIPGWYKPSLWPWPWRQQSQIVKQHSGSWWCTSIPNLPAKGLKSIQEIWKKQLFLRIWPPRTVTETLKIGTQPCAWHSGSARCSIIPRLVAYSSVVRKISSGQRCDRRTHGHTDTQTPIYRLSNIQIPKYLHLTTLQGRKYKLQEEVHQHIYYI